MQDAAKTVINEALEHFSEGRTDWIKDAGPSLGLKFDNGKPRFDLVPPLALLEVVKIFSYGAQKYDDRNWEQGIEFGRVYGAMQRHLHAYWSGEDIDPESGLPHMAHAAFGCLALLEFSRTHPELDDRPKT